MGEPIEYIVSIKPSEDFLWSLSLFTTTSSRYIKQDFSTEILCKLASGMMTEDNEMNLVNALGDVRLPSFRINPMAHLVLDEGRISLKMEKTEALQDLHVAVASALFDHMDPDHIPDVPGDSMNFVEQMHAIEKYGSPEHGALYCPQVYVGRLDFDSKEDDAFHRIFNNYRNSFDKVDWTVKRFNLSKRLYGASINVETFRLEDTNT